MEWLEIGNTQVKVHVPAVLKCNTWVNEPEVTLCCQVFPYDSFIGIRRVVNETMAISSRHKEKCWETYKVREPRGIIIIILLSSGAPIG